MKILIKAVIPVRKNSQRVINKNLRKFNKKNLLIYKINKLRKLNFLNEIIVNTDSDKAIDIAKKVKYPIGNERLIMQAQNVQIVNSGNISLKQQSQNISFLQIALHH